MSAPPWLHGRRIDGPGCGDGCIAASMIVAGHLVRADVEVHDPAAHEAYGRRLAQPEEAPVRTGGLAVDIGGSTVMLDGRLIAPTMTELRILFVLARRVGRVATHAELAAGTWGFGTLDQPLETYRHALRVNMTRLRRRLRPHGGLISTVPELGYRLEALPIGSAAPTPSDNYHLRIDGWATDWDRCRGCGLTDLPYAYSGYCVSCVEHRAPRARRGAVADWHAQAARIALATRPEGP
ncbi:MAG TPA: winged helix-turn-helix domain-containing protein [Marmoricola sp.]|jgi:DNA-binding winged helix-turn-helix (wHTH) protein